MTRRLIFSAIVIIAIIAGYCLLPRLLKTSDRVSGDARHAPRLAGS